MNILELKQKRLNGYTRFVSRDEDIKSFVTHVEVTLSGEIDPRRLLTLARDIAKRDGWYRRNPLIVDASAGRFHTSLAELNELPDPTATDGDTISKTVWIGNSSHCAEAAQMLELLLSRCGTSAVTFADSREEARAALMEEIEA